jgi:thermosome
LIGIPIILKEGTKTETGSVALNENISAIRAISEAVKSTFGPSGLNKMLVDSIGEVTITNDTYTILDEIEVEHPAAKMIKELAKVMNINSGDGITKAVIFAGELLKNGKDLMDQKIHPNIIINGFSKALIKAESIIDELSKQISIDNRDILKNIAITALNSKSTYGAQELLANIAIDSILKIIEKRGFANYIDLDLVQILKKEGEQLQDTQKIDGIIIDKEVVHNNIPKIINSAKIALLNHSLEITKTEFDTDIKITNPNQIISFKHEEENMIKTMIDKIVETGANVIFCQKGIDDLAQDMLAQKGVMAIRRVKRSDLIKLCKATHANIIVDIKTMKPGDLGNAEKVSENQIGKDKMIFVENCKNPNSISILIRGSTKQIIEEAEKSFKNALNVIKNVVENPKIIPGAGAIEIEIAKQLRKHSQTISTRESIAIELFSNTLEIIPITLAENSGMNAMEIITELRAKHEDMEGISYGIDSHKKQIVDAMKEGIIEPANILKKVLSSAVELSVMIFKVDRVVSVAKGSTGPKMPTKKDEEDLD